MKFVLHLALIILPCLAFAQEQKENSPQPIRLDKPFKNELGVLFQGGMGNNNNNNDVDMILAGVQYSHWVNERVGYRIIGAYGQYSSYSGVNSFAVNQDTVLRKQTEIRINMPVLGAGLMAQRHFYRRVYLFAGLELRGAYGNGTRDTLVQTEYTGPDNFIQVGYRSGRASSDVSLLLINVDASIGAKLQFRRLVVGAEVLPLNVSYRLQNIDGSSYGIMDANLGTFSNRVFLQYRF